MTEISIEELVWNERNIEHIKRHDVVPEEVEDALHNDPLVEETYTNRYLIIAQTTTGRWLAIVLEPLTDTVFFPVTARTAHRSERRRYSQEKGGMNQ